MSTKPGAWLNDNGVFLPGCLVNQRGQTEWSTTAYSVLYTIDRWFIDIAATVRVESDGLVIEKGRISENLENYSVLKGKTVTGSVLLSDGTLGAVSFTMGENIGGWEAGTTGIRIFSLDGLHFCLHNSSGQSKKLIAAKLELGTVQTLAHQDSSGKWVLNELPNYADQLMRCQRELYRDGGSDYVSVGYGLAETAQTAYFLVKLPAPMRVIPSVTYAGNWTVWDGVTAREIASISVNGGATKPKDCSFVNIKVDITGNDLTIGKMYQLMVRSDKFAYIEFVT